MHTLDTKTQHSILSEHTSTTTQLLNLSTSQHICYCFPILEDNLLPLNCCTTITLCISLVILRVSCYFHSTKWRLQRSVDDVSIFCLNYLFSFYEVCSLACFQKSPWWNCFCEVVWQHRIACWHRNDPDCSFVSAHLVYEQTIQDYKDKMKGNLQQHCTSKHWLLLTKGLLGYISSGKTYMSRFFDLSLNPPGWSVFYSLWILMNLLEMIMLVHVC